MSKAVRQGLNNVFLLYCFGTSTALYSPLALFVRPLLFLSFFAILLSILYNTSLLHRPIPNSIIFIIVGILTLVYVVWMFIAIVYGNNLTYILQDSSGFIIYLLTPAYFIFIKTNNLEKIFCKFILNLCTFIASVSLSIILLYYISFGPVEPISLVTLNTLVESYKLNWIIDNNSGFIGLYTYTAQFLLLGIGLSFYFYYISKQRRYIYLILLYCFGLFADGHRALIVSLFLLIILLCPLIIKTFTIKRLFVNSIILVIPLILVLIINVDWFLDRFNFTESDPSTAWRILQIPALLDKIIERPILGNGFGSFASIIRHPERPFYYEVDFLATLMKIGLLGSFLYFGVYLYTLNVARRFGGIFGYIMFCVGLSFLFYMGTNGGTAMSPDSAIFHMFLFILIFLSISHAREIWMK